MIADEPMEVARGLSGLTIREIELIPIVVPLGREYRGSYYSMTNRATIITRIHTDEGIVGEAYAARRGHDAAGDHRRSCATRSSRA